MYGGCNIMSGSLFSSLRLSENPISKAQRYLSKSNTQLNHSTSSDAAVPVLTARNTMSQAEVELNKCLSKQSVSAEPEPLLKNYSCALLRDGSILLQGRIFITSFHICFYSNILGYETKVCIDWKDVVSITKEKTAKVFSNAIAITTTDKQYFFASFIHRKNAFRVMQLVWKYSKMGVQLTKVELSELIEEMRRSLSQGSESVDGIEPHDDSIDDHNTNMITDTAVGKSKQLLTVANRMDHGGSNNAADSTTSTSNTDLDYLSDHNSETTLTEKISITSGGDSSTSSTSSINSFLLMNTVTGDHSTDCTPGDDSLAANINQWNHNGKYFRNPAVIINLIIIILIVLLIFSMLTTICKLSEYDPKLQSWLPWQPWCILICK